MNRQNVMSFLDRSLEYCSRWSLDAQYVHSYRDLLFPSGFHSEQDWPDFNIGKQNCAAFTLICDNGSLEARSVQQQFNPIKKSIFFTIQKLEAFCHKKNILFFLLRHIEKMGSVFDKLDTFHLDFELNE